MAETGVRSDQVKIARTIGALPRERKYRIILYTTAQEVWQEFDHVITKDKVQEIIYSDFKKIKHIKEVMRQFIDKDRFYIRLMMDLKRD